ncbi:dipeptidase [Paraburkholderia sp. BL21I4N1]|uniref:dipeptidase n=1 Tax=Paraburkholderia sp. BL21I4N1 TaxID=1938801 RepID=UPI000CFDF992|nr:membrane dipeptidase [Paraburkholderia sp. BL21I4N1]PQV46365.1 membrane dipeptidase [Paraburkholderia sp. BL21I4N1]
MTLDWPTIRDGNTDTLHDTTIDITGWMIPLDPQAESVDYFLLSADEPCCGGCVPRNPAASIEVYTAVPLAPQADAVTLRGRLLRLIDDPAGWRYRLVEATALESPHAVPRTFSRRTFLSSGVALGLAACAPGRFASYTDPHAQDDPAAPASGDSAASSQAASSQAPSWQAPSGTLAIDMHSHAGRVIVSRDPAIGAHRPFLPLAAPMRKGGMNVICLAIVTDTTVTRVAENHKRFEAWRDPQPGELYALGQTEFQRAHQLIERERMQVVTNAASLAGKGSLGPCAIISAEGGDFLEGQVDRVDEAYVKHQLRHLQLTHYRVNELGDIQTEPPVHGGLTDTGAEVVRRCNALGIVVDVAHGTYNLVKRAADTSTKPLVLSHSALATHPSSRSRLITPDHARVIAGTGGVIGVWPSSGSFKDIHAMAEGIKRMADVVGVEHVGLGSDMLGFISPPVFRSYEQLPDLASALLVAGFTQEEVSAILGGNYRRVFEVSVG